MAKNKRQRLSDVVVAKPVKIQTLGEVEKVIEPENPGYILNVTEVRYKAFMVKRRQFFAQEYPSMYEEY